MADLGQYEPESMAIRERPDNDYLDNDEVVAEYLSADV
jgi:hypothetical protein